MRGGFVLDEAGRRSAERRRDQPGLGASLARPFGMETLRKTSHVLAPIALTALRIGTGAIMAVHGWLKLIDYSSWVGMVQQLGIPAPELMAALGLAAELGGGIALILGFLTPIASAMILVNMLVAIFVVHWESGLLTESGGFEFPLTLGLVALYFLVRGAGPISVDHALFGIKRRRRIEEPREPAPTRRPAPA